VINLVGRLLLVVTILASVPLSGQKTDDPFDRVPGGAPHRLSPGSGYLASESTLTSMAHRAGVPTGLERSHTQRTFRRSPEVSATDFSSISLRESWQILQRFDPEYETRILSGVLVIRPKSAWTHADHPLHRRVSRFEVVKVSLPELTWRIGTLLSGSTQPYRVHPAAKIPLNDWTLHLERTSVLEILNAAARAPGRVSWVYADRKEVAADCTLYLHTPAGESSRVGCFPRPQ
jgi:hypothetical protein